MVNFLGGFILLKCLLNIQLMTHMLKYQVEYITNKFLTLSVPSHLIFSSVLHVSISILLPPTQFLKPQTWKFILSVSISFTSCLPRQMQVTMTLWSLCSKKL